MTHSIFNSPLEIALRLLIIIDNINEPIDIDKLNIYDYLLVNSGDIPNAPQSLHPKLPMRNAQLYVKRKKTQTALNLLLSKELIGINFTEEGIMYQSTNLTSKFLEYFESPYFIQIKKRMTWILLDIVSMSEEEQGILLKKHLNKWDNEFASESLFVNI